MITPDVEYLIDGLVHLIGTDVERNVATFHRLDCEVFDGFECFSYAHRSHDQFVLLGDVDTPAIWPMNACFASRDAKDGSWSFHRVSSVSAKHMRGKLRVVADKMYLHRIARCEANGNMRTAQVVWAVLGTKLVDALNRGCAPIMPTQQDHELISISHGVALRKHYMWSVLLGEGSGPRARFVTDPIGCREAFRLRDIPPGAKRRTALKHWVSEHWRKRRGLERQDFEFVKRHLRGANSFTWNGLSCTIVPSVEDLDKARRSGYNEIELVS